MKVFLPDGTYEYTLPEATSLTIDERIVTIVKKSILDMQYAPHIGYKNGTRHSKKRSTCYRFLAAKESHWEHSW